LQSILRTPIIGGERKKTNMNDSKTNEDQTLKILSDMIEEAFAAHYSNEKGEQKKPKQSSLVEKQSLTPLYTTLEEYTSVTGKRFRMTKDQKQRDLSREEAFNETFGGTK